MKRAFLNQYWQIVYVSWAVIILLLWIQYIYLSSLLLATLLLIVHIPAVYLSIVLTNRWLSRAVNRKKQKLFIFQFIGTTIFTSFILALNFQLMRWVEIHGYLPNSILLENHTSLAIDFLFAIPNVLVINFGFCGLRFFYEHMSLKKAHLENQLQLLQSQINPHFMFNVLNHIHTLMQTNVELASSLLLQYADMLRFQLYKGKGEKVELRDEILFLQNFIEIEKIRWGKKIVVTTNWVIEQGSLKIPPLLLIIFIENAFKFASRTISEQGFVAISLQQQGSTLSLTVENSKPVNSINESTHDKATGLGLANVKQRLNILYGENHLLNIEETKTTYYSKLEIWQI
ncbi:sensor histidine kinase [Bacteroides sp.]|uniref:sensor histidine kinase n=1 Tax=Bacteroides sp. TaxID=29523 RepID=UPI003AB7C788